MAVGGSPRMLRRLRRLRWLRTSVRADVLEGRWKPANAPEWPLSRYFQPQITGGVRHKLHTMLQPSSKVSKGPTPEPTALRPFAASFAPIHFAQPRDTPKTTQPAPCPACDPATLATLAAFPTPPPQLAAQYYHQPPPPPSILCCSCSAPHDDHHDASCVWMRGYVDVCVCVCLHQRGMMTRQPS